MEDTEMKRKPKELAPGTRVRLRAPTPGLALESDLGTVICPDRYGDYYVIQLDEPALYDHGGEEPEVLSEVVELIDNLDILTDERPADVEAQPARRRAAG
jgi:hypothetical protein